MKSMKAASFLSQSAGSKLNLADGISAGKSVRTGSAGVESVDSCSKSHAMDESSFDAIEKKLELLYPFFSF